MGGHTCACARSKGTGRCDGPARPTRVRPAADLQRQLPLLLPRCLRLPSWAGFHPGRAVRANHCRRCSGACPARVAIAVRSECYACLTRPPAAAAPLPSQGQSLMAARCRCSRSQGRSLRTAGPRAPARHPAAFHCHNITPARCCSLHGLRLPTAAVVVLTESRPPQRGALEWVQAQVAGGGAGAGRAPKRQRREGSSAPASAAPSASVDSCGGEASRGELEETADSSARPAAAEEAAALAAGRVVAGIVRRGKEDELLLSVSISWLIIACSPL